MSRTQRILDRINEALLQSQEDAEVQSDPLYDVVDSDEKRLSWDSWKFYLKFPRSTLLEKSEALLFIKSTVPNWDIN